MKDDPNYPLEYHFEPGEVKPPPRNTWAVLLLLFVAFAVAGAVGECWRQAHGADAPGISARRP